MPILRQVLGALLLEQEKALLAEQVYRQVLRYNPQNGWSLFGLLATLREQGKDSDTDAAEVVEELQKLAIVGTDSNTFKRMSKSIEQYDFEQALEDLEIFNKEIISCKAT